MTPTRALSALTSALVAMATLVTGLVAGPTAYAVDEPPRPAFYEAPAQLPPANGTVIRHERMRFLLDPWDAGSLVTNSERVLYRSTDRAGKATAVSGVVMVPKTAWLGPGSRPVIGYAPGTQGMADRCAPSRQYSEGLEYEGAVVQGLLTRGYAVAVTDYEGLGTEGIHTYMDRVSQGRALLDVVRAAQRIPGTGISSASPVGLQGYSQGGGAAAAAVELAPSYAPELDLRGAAVGAVPADLEQVANHLDGTLYSSFAFFALRGLSASYGVDLTPYLNTRGREVHEEVEEDCVFNLLDNAFVRSETLSATGEPMSQLVEVEPYTSIVEDQRIGTIAPQVPVLVSHSLFDDVIPHAVGKELARSWCDRGAELRFRPTLVPTHLGGYVPFAAQAAVFWERRFADKPLRSNCWTL